MKITERGWAGHFICAERCLFRRNTLIEHKDKRIVVSSVGLMKMDNGEIDTIGCDRYYETMVFEAQYIEPYWEADVTKQISFDSPWSLNERTRDSDEKMNKQHNTVVKEITKMMKGNKNDTIA